MVLLLKERISKVEEFKIVQVLSVISELSLAFNGCFVMWHMFSWYQDSIELLPEPAAHVINCQLSIERLQYVTISYTSLKLLDTGRYVSVHVGTCGYVCIESSWSLVCSQRSFALTHCSVLQLRLWSGSTDLHQS